MRSTFNPFMQGSIHRAHGFDIGYLISIPRAREHLIVCTMEMTNQLSIPSRKGAFLSLIGTTANLFFQSLRAREHFVIQRGKPCVKVSIPSCKGAFKFDNSIVIRNDFNPFVQGSIGLSWGSSNIFLFQSLRAREHWTCTS